MADDVVRETELTPEQLEIVRTVEAFSHEQVEPNARAIERKEPGVLVGLLKKAGELGFLMADVPEEFGGTGADFYVRGPCDPLRARRQPR